MEGKRFISITHDFTWILKNPQVTFEGMRAPGGANRNYLLQPFLQKLEMKSQHETTANLYRMSGAPFRSLHVVPMPDHFASLEPVLCTGKRLKVGVIGAISKIKGARAVEQLFQLVDGIIFGSIDSSIQESDPDGDAVELRSEPFSHISQLNRLLRRELPNVLIVTAEWPETYSYTLTLSMLTKLPIIVMKHPKGFDDCAMPTRARDYRNVHFHNFSSIVEVATLAEQIKGDHLQLINPRVNVPSQWANILAPTLKNVVLVASKILTSAHPLSYFPTRSRFTPKQRFLSCLETIASIRRYVPDSYVVFIDNSDFPSVDGGVSWAAELRQKSDAFINDSLNQSLAYYTDVSDHKGLGEALLLEQGMDWLERNQVMFGMVFKLTARYTINSNFKFSQYRTTTNIFKQPEVGVPARDAKPTYIYTSFFKIADGHVPAFRASLRNIISTLIYMTDHQVPTALFDDIESRLAASLPDVQLVKQLGITQNVSTYATPDVYI